MRKICYISGTRADFGLMAATLRQIQDDPRLALSLLVTGMHLSPLYGETIREIHNAGLRIAGEVRVNVDAPTGASMARGIATMLDGFTVALAKDRPDLVLLLGDRGEMLAGAIAALHLGIPIAHIHGGERSGSVDEPVRHAISKLAHLHFTATSAARERLIRMGEDAARVWVTGAPGLDGLAEAATIDRATLCAEVGLDPARKIALCVFHPVVNDSTDQGAQLIALLHAALSQGCQVIALEPNSDAGSAEIRSALAALSANHALVVRKHLERGRFVSWMAECDVMIGNSSSGIIEAATFGTPVVDVGPRQHLRETGANVIHAPASEPEIAAAIEAALRAPREPGTNIYGDSRARERIVNILATHELATQLLAKCNAY